jgi:hypothetical protein
LEIQEIIGGEHFRPPKKALIWGYPLCILGKIHIFGGEHFHKLLSTVVLRYLRNIFNEGQIILMFGYQSRIYLVITGYGTDIQRIYNGYLKGYLGYGRILLGYGRIT